MKERLVAKLAEHLRLIETGDLRIVGVNAFMEGEPSPLALGLGDGLSSIERIEQETEDEQRAALAAWRSERDEHQIVKLLDGLRRGAEGDENVMDATLEAARGGVTTGEWAGALREVFGSYRGPTGVSGSAAGGGGDPDALEEARRAVGDAAGRRGVPKLRLLVAKARPGRPFERRRAGGPASPRLRVRGHLPGHPAHPS